MVLHGANLIAGEQSAEGKARFQGREAESGMPLDPTVHEATATEIDRALRAAEDAFPTYRSCSPALRAAFLRAIGDRMEDAGAALTERGCIETGLPAGRLEMERGRTVNQLRMFADLVEEGSWVEARIDRADPARKPIPKPDIRRMLSPIGPVAVFGASNFPLAFSVAGGDTASALAAGNPVVVKAHPAHPGVCELSAEAVLDAVEACDLPAGVFSLVHGQSNDVGLALVRHPLTRAVGFTGSHAGGRALMEAAAARPVPIPVYAEMGSVNPVFILPHAMRARGAAIAEGLVASVTLGAGQFCTNPGVVVGLAGPDFDAFAAEAGRRIAASRPATMLHAGICQGFHRGAARLANAHGVECVASGPDGTDTQAGGVLFLTDARTFAAQPQLRQEVFGPASLLVACASIEEMAQAARLLRGNLTATLHADAEDADTSRRLAEILVDGVGRLLYNGFPTGVEVCAAMHHGGPYPATSNAHETSVGTAAIRRFARPICFQNAPQEMLPAELRNENPRKIWRLVDGAFTRDAL